MKTKDLTGQRFGSLVVIEVVSRNMKPHNTHWLCQCTCGNKLIVRSDNLRMGHSTQCSQCGGRNKSVFVSEEEQ